MFSNLKKKCSMFNFKKKSTLYWMNSPLLTLPIVPCHFAFRLNFFFFFCKCIKGADIRVTVFSQYSLDLKLISHLSFSCVSLCWFVCVLVYMHFSICVYACVCMCTCLFGLVVPTVLARKRSPPPRTHPGGVCLRWSGRGHHQQNIPDLQCGSGTVTQNGQATNKKSILCDQPDV